VNARREPRIEVSQPVQVTILQKPETQLRGHVLNISGRGMRLLLDRPVTSGIPIKIRWENTLVLGEVCYCQRLPEGKEFAVGLRLEHCLTNTVEIARLAHKLLGSVYEPVTS
jgi:c-di-GMP-binding flagellar brake protein YcgR